MSPICKLLKSSALNVEPAKHTNWHKESTKPPCIYTFYRQHYITYEKAIQSYFEAAVQRACSKTASPCSRVQATYVLCLTCVTKTLHEIYRMIDLVQGKVLPLHDAQVHILLQHK